MDKERSIYEILDIMRDDQQRFDNTIADLRTHGTSLPQRKWDVGEKKEPVERI